MFVRLKALMKAYGTTVGAVLAYLLCIGYPTVVAIENPMPHRDELVSISARILVIQQSTPNLTLQMSDGTKVNANFPGNLYFLTPLGSPRFGSLDRDEMRRLQGCDASFKVKHIDWHYPDLFSVWDMQSVCGHYDYQRAVSYFEKIGTFGVLVAWNQLFCAGLVAFVFFVDRKRLRSRQERPSRH